MKKITFVFLIILITSIAGCGQAAPKEKKPVESTVNTTEQTISKETGIESSEESGVEDIVAISVKINPEAILYVDSDQVVVSVEMVNQDAKDAYEQFTFEGMGFTDAIEIMIDTCIEQKYLSEDNSDIVIVPAEEKETDVALANQIIETSVPQINDYVSEKEIMITVSTEITVDESSQNASNAINESSEASTDTSADSPVDPQSSKSTDLSTPESQENVEKCSLCNGTGVCPACNGTGYLDGATSVCKACDGDGYMTCTFCEGGTTTCSRCGGDGMDQSETCTKCGGSGRQTCQYCGGKSEYPCMHCPGDGINRYYCKKCSDGTTVGDGKCPKCHGTGIE